MRRICLSMMKAPRLPSATVVTLVLLLTLALLLSVSGCDYGSSPSGDTPSVVSLQKPPPQPLPDDPEGMLEAIVAATERVTRYTCSLQVDAELTLEPGELTQEDLMFMGMIQGPLTLSGDMAIDEDAGAAQMDLSFGMAGITYSMGLRALDDEVYMSILGQWYDLAPAVEELDSEAFVESLDLEVIEARVSELGVDPLAWLGDVELVDEETLDGSDVYHLTCTPDVVLIIDDLLVLIGDEELMGVIDPAGELSASWEQDVGMPTEAELEEMRSVLPEMFPEFTIDVWAGKQDSILRKVEVSMQMTPPPGEPAEGFESLELLVLLTIGDIGKPVEVEIPEGALPFTELENMFGPGFLTPFDEQLREPTSA